MSPPLFAINFGSGIVNSLLTTVIHSHTPEAILGRALEAFMSTAMLASPVSMLIGGALIASQRLGVATLAGALVVALAAGTLAFNSTRAELGGPTPARSTPQ